MPVPQFIDAWAATMTEKTRGSKLKRSIGLHYQCHQLAISNVVANICGVLIVTIISNKSIHPAPQHIQTTTTDLDYLFRLIVFSALIIIPFIYENPIRRSLWCIQSKIDLPERQLAQSRRRLLNEPFFLVILNLALWTSGAIIYAVVLNVEDPGKTYIARVFFQTIITGLITSVASFFLTEHALRKNLASAFFPDGGLFGTPGTLRIRIGTRLAFLILSCNVIPCLVFFIIVRGTYQTEVAPEIMILALRDTIQTNTLLFFVTGVSLAVIVSRSLTVPIKEIVSLLKNISHGDLNEKIQVISNDEIGYTGDVINEMIDALRDREMIRHSLQLAHEVQLSLLPEREPKTAFCDISGVSIYCEQTGGDYYDFIEFENPADRKLGIVVGDVSGHGLPAALLMSTARAMIRTVSSVQDALARVVSSVNSHLARDIGESGQFMTLFYLVVDGRNRTLRWVRAGHDPALLYTPETDNFVELEGPGLALGIDHRYDYIESERGFSTGQIILIGTDGLWEAINIKNEMLGKDRIKTAVRQNAMRSAAEIKDSILSVVKEHRGIRKLEDDMTFTVIKGC